MISVNIVCGKCHKDFKKVAYSAQFVAQTADAFSHCDACEERLRAQKRGNPCDVCTTAPRNKPYRGELRQYCYPMQPLPAFHKFYVNEKGGIVVYDTRPKPIEIPKMAEPWLTK